MWPMWSILTDLLSIPALFAAGAYCFIVALGTGRLPLIYAVLFTTVTCGAAAWYLLRGAARKADVHKAQRSGSDALSSEQLGRLLK
ncbi:MAG: hypothetical protein JWN92_487 [Candidatus Acidoferrum typicum]|nr:hypothetical protein [Candidatus Acidoferrum typicum]